MKDLPSNPTVVVLGGAGGMAGADMDLRAVKGASVESGVAEGAALLAYTEAAMAADTAAIISTRDTLAEALGHEGVAEAAAVIAMFNVVDRVADATGIPIDEGFTRQLRYGGRSSSTRPEDEAEWMKSSNSSDNRKANFQHSPLRGSHDRATVRGSF